MIVAIGLHEAPGGRGEDLTWLLREHGFRSDFAVVCELSGDTFVAAHMGQATVEITIARAGIVTHELKTRGRDAASDHGRRPRDRGDRARATQSWPRPSTRGSGRRRTSSARCTAATSTTASRPSAASSARAAGRPGNTLEAVEAEFRELLEPIAAETGCSIELDLRLVRGAYSIDPEHELSRALRAGYEDVTGTELPLTGIKVVADAAVFQGEAAIPTVYHGPAGSGAHGDVEFDARRGARPRDAGLPDDAPAPVGA